MEQIQYDANGRMKYHPRYHKRTGLIWDKQELQYLFDYYDKIGSIEMSYALERTETSIFQKVQKLRNEGVMKKSKERRCFKR